MLIFTDFELLSKSVSIDMERRNHSLSTKGLFKSNFYITRFKFVLQIVRVQLL